MQAKRVERTPALSAARLGACLAFVVLSCGFIGGSPEAEGGSGEATGSAASGPSTPSGRAGEDARPNIVFYYTDDQDSDQYGYTGGAAYTPTIDRLARDGMVFSRFYISSPVCTPSRYSSLTGMYASRSAAVRAEYPLPNPSCLTWNAELRPGERTFAHVLRDAGYATGIVGKWMCGSPEDLAEVSRYADPEDPDVLARMASNYTRICSWIREQYGFDYAERIYRNNLPGIGMPREYERHNLEWITEGALEFIEANAQRPFCLYFATTVPHSPANPLDGDPLITPAGMLDERPRVQPLRGNVLDRNAAAGLPREAAVYTWIDDSVAAVLDKLDELGIADNTLVLFAPDHGVRGKYTCYGGHVPLLARWPARIPRGQVCDELTSNIDLAPTFFELAGATPPEGTLLDGQSLMTLFGGQGRPLRDSLLLEMGYAKAIVTRDWKYVALRYPEEIQAEVDAAPPRTYMQDGTTRRRARGAKEYPGYFDYDQLYDFRADPDDQFNLAGLADCEDTLNELHRGLGELLATHPNPFGEFHRVPGPDGEFFGGEPPGGEAAGEDPADARDWCRR